MNPTQIAATEERETLLGHVEGLLEIPMNILALVWLVLTIVELTHGLSRSLETATTVIWILFWVDYLLKFTIAPNKIDFVRRSWLTLLALILPALRLFRVFRALRFVRLLKGGRLVKVLSSFNRWMLALRRNLRQRGFVYILALTVTVNLLGAAGIYAFENGQSDYFSGFGSAVWWTAMMLTTMGSDYFPKSFEGKILSLLLAVYGFAVFGYVTATVASFFIDRAAADPASDVASEETLKQILVKLESLQDEISQLKELKNR